MPRVSPRRIYKFHRGEFITAEESWDTGDRGRSCGRCDRIAPGSVQLTPGKVEDFRIACKASTRELIPFATLWAGEG